MIINEIFTSIDGEVSTFHQGTMSTFIRFAGCNLKCPYCDTKYAQKANAGEIYEQAAIFNLVKTIGCKKITITGGEPLLQVRELIPLIKELLYKGHKVTVETNGSIELPQDLYDENFGWIVDYKLWCWEKMITKNFTRLTSCDWIKLVLQSPEEYYLAKETVSRLRDLGSQANVALSTVFGKFSPADLISMIKKDKFWDVTVNVQLHKIIWDSEKRGI